MGNVKAMAIGVVLVTALFLPVMVSAQPRPPAGVGNDTNAATLCGEGFYLGGGTDGCLPIPPNVETTCLAGEALLGDGTTCVNVLEMQAQIAALSAKNELLMQCLKFEHHSLNTDRYLNLGLTVFDCQTWLEWEKKTEDNVDDTFTWSTCGGPDPAYRPLGNCPPDGTAFDYIEQLNTAPCFAGHCDWRLPEMGPPFDFLGGVKLNGDPADTEELRTIQDCSFLPCIDPIFGPTLLSEPTPEDTNYWTSVTITGFPSSAWSANFYASIGGTGATDKSLSISVRAVRNGP